MVLPPMRLRMRKLRPWLRGARRGRRCRTSRLRWRRVIGIGSSSMRSYVILDRAVPHIDDGLKPVQRRVLHTLWDMDEGRFHKVANVVGATMKLHPHGDASIR